MAYNPDPRLVDAIVSTAPAGDRAIALAVALVESGGRLDAVGDGGRSHGPYQEYDAGRGAGIPIAGRRDPVAATQRFIRELSQYRRRGFTGGELAYRTQRPADHGGYVRKINAALPEAKRILAGYGGGSGSALPAGAAPGLRAPAGRGATSPASAAGLRLTPALEAKLSRYLARSREQVMMGETPDDPLEIVQAISRLQPAPLVTDYGGRTRAARTPTGPGHHAGDGRDHGFPTGPVDSGRVTPGGLNGDWGGSMPLALALARSVGATPSSQKRSRRLTASGGVSDHWQGSTTSYATDLPTSGAAGDALFRKIEAALGVKLKMGQWNNVNIGGYRYQIGWRTSGHFDHIHVGVKRL